MNRNITRVCVAVATAAGLSALGLGAAIPAGAGIHGPQEAGAPSLAASGARAVPGTQLWVSSYPNGRGFSVAVSPAGDKVFVGGGYSTASGSSDYLTIAYSAVTGTQLWATRYNGPASNGDHAAALVVSPDGTKVFVTGSSETSTPSPEHEGALYTDYATAAYDAATGAQLWAARYNGTANHEDRAKAVAVNPGGGTVFVTGFSQSAGAESGSYATVAYSAATGAQLWVKRYNANGAGGARSVVSPGNGKVYVTGSARTAGAAPDYATVAYNTATGKQAWAKRYNGPANSVDDAYALAVKPDRSAVFVTGISWSGSTGHSEDYATVGYNASSGARLWSKRYNGPAGRADEATSVVVSSGGGKVFVTGTSYTSGSTLYDYATLAYRSTTGARLWLTRYNSPGSGFDLAAAVTSPGNGKVYVTGESEDQSATLAYSTSTGTQLWSHRYTGSGGTYSMAVSPNGTKVFVTGTVTIAYAG